MITERYRQSLTETKDKDMFSLGYQWTDKPHRHVYDLCNVLDNISEEIETEIIVVNRAIKTARLFMEDSSVEIQHLMKLSIELLIEQKKFLLNLKEMLK